MYILKTTETSVMLLNGTINNQIFRKEVRYLLFFSLVELGVLTQGFTLAKQVLSH
jgi:hypothetical protein